MDSKDQELLQELREGVKTRMRDDLEAKRRVWRKEYDEFKKSRSQPIENLQDQICSFGRGIHQFLLNEGSMGLICDIDQVCKLIDMPDADFQRWMDNPSSLE